MTTAQVESVPLREPKKVTSKQLELKGYTPKVLSEMADISISGAYRILKGERMPGAAQLAKLADVVGMDMGELYAELLSRKAA